ncbi:MAG: Phage envelope protein [Herbinix sp.]|jgi:uncharacterized protein YbcV (DUF1398 family)|nr:Phage envelope protein [Herbinix sp.]
MEFTLQAIHEAHKKYTGPDFPKLIREFRLMGMVTNTYDLRTGQILYVNKNGDQIESQSSPVNVKIGDFSCQETALAALKRNQIGESDFATFCNEIAQAGVYKWISDLEKMTCSYYDLQENAVIVETIPSV